MKNETARREIESLDYYLQNHTDDYSEESHTAMMMAIKALGQQFCEDKYIKEIDHLRKYISKLETQIVEQEPKTGHWIPSHIPESILDECSECGFSCGAFTFNYCPNCGAKMIDPQESERINCKTTKCENCQNHNYCDYEPQESEDKE